MQRLIIYQNPNREWICQSPNKKGFAGSYRSLSKLVSETFRNYFDFLRNRFDDNFSNYKRDQILGYVKNIVKIYDICYIDFPGDLESGLIDESINQIGSATYYIFNIRKS